ncbi:hypothetical protein [Rhodopila sp.]|uniref:hypothetical protein n=1 Tax=Rhodopila sp. TaxID=2480087 RepID=UPI003D0BC358
MSENHGPDLSAMFEMLSAMNASNERQAAVLEQQQTLLVEVKQLAFDLKAVLQEEVASVRVDLMARMDRLQDTATRQRDDITLLLDLAMGNKNRAELSLTEARAAVDMQGSNSSALIALQRKVMDLEAQVRELREGKPL